MAKWFSTSNLQVFKGLIVAGKLNEFSRLFWVKGLLVARFCCQPLHNDVAWSRSFSTFARSCCLLCSFVWHFFLKGLPNLVHFWQHCGSKTHNFPIAPLGSKSTRRREASAEVLKLHTSCKQWDIICNQSAGAQKRREICVQSILVYDTNRPCGK